MQVERGKIARELAELEEQMDRAFERALAGAVRLPVGADAWRPALDVYETERAIVVRVELAGVSSDDVRVVVDGEYLQITGRRSFARASSSQRHLLLEIAQGTFERVLRTRAAYDPDRVTARLETGILTIELPRRENAGRVVSVRT
ncbi:MAG TPA: Hsp20/alpha crystallin family protein [Myxococcota bacterium]|nr:Hsp20/alpha crystallin family protein [Myxococcota bacterium]